MGFGQFCGSGLEDAVSTGEENEVEASWVEGLEVGDAYNTSRPDLERSAGKGEVRNVLGTCSKDRPSWQLGISIVARVYLVFRPCSDTREDD